MIDMIEYNKSNESAILERLRTRTSQFYKQFSKPLPSNEKIFGSALSANESVRKILSDIEADGEEAIQRYSEIFDGVRPEPMQVDKKKIQEAIGQLKPDVVEALKLSVKNVSSFQRRMLPADVNLSKNNNARTGSYFHPIERVGIYIPGGTAPLCSSVIMNALPAVVAGVPEIVLFTPPKKDGEVDNGILAACELVGVSEIYRIGGVMAIGMMAYGTKNFKKVDKIAGPGNSFVALAKKEVYGRVDIDLFAGPSEILIIADASSRPHFIAADMLAQAEHDKVASSFLITDRRDIAEAVRNELKKQIQGLPRADIAAEALKNFGMIVLVSSIDDAIYLSNLIAPEHLELCVRHSESYIQKIRNTGAIFLGNYTPEAAGDYLAGPSHTLPTSGTGRFYSGVSSATFMRRTSVIEYREVDFEQDALAIAALARLEKLEAHARSALIRVGKPW